MKLPAVAIAAIFASGIAFGLSPDATSHASSHRFVTCLFAASAVTLLAGSFLAFSKKFAPAALASITCRTLLGFTGAVLDQQPPRPDHILQLASAGKVDLKSPLRYFGQVRDEPANLPWGTSFELSLSTVESEGTLIPVTGGLRISYIRRVVKKTETLSTEQFSTSPLSKLHAGDAVAVLTQARLPSVYHDEGAFDRRRLPGAKECRRNRHAARCRIISAGATSAARIAPLAPSSLPLRRLLRTSRPESWKSIFWMLGKAIRFL